MILDRALKLEWLDLALQLGARDQGQAERYVQLDAQLTEDIPQRAARVKTRRMLAHAWLTPPEPAAQMIRWATSQAHRAANRRVLHIGALLATYPFFGDLCSIVGKELALSEEVSTLDVRRKARARWGDRTTIDVSTRAGIRTLRMLGVVLGKKGETKSCRGLKLEVQPELAAWIAHALLLTRGIDEIDEREIGKAPELFMFELPTTIAASYPYLERFNEGGGRVIFQARRLRVQEPDVRRLGSQLALGIETS